MSAAVVGLALFAAILHATWNPFLRTGPYRLCTVARMTFSQPTSPRPYPSLLRRSAPPRPRLDRGAAKNHGKTGHERLPGGVCSVSDCRHVGVLRARGSVD